MISKALTLIISQLNQYIPSSNGDVVVLGNIALHESENSGLTDKGVVVTLVNIEEESTLKNNKSFIKNNTDVTYRNPPVNLNLYLLFSAISSGNEIAYNTSLTRLSQVIRFFQGKNTFTLQNSPGVGLPEDEDLQDMKLILELYTLTFEQINYLWGSLGGKQMPFVMYKARLITIDAKRVVSSGKVIEEIESREKVK